MLDFLRSCKIGMAYTANYKVREILSETIKSINQATIPQSSASD